GIRPCHPLAARATCDDRAVCGVRGAPRARTSASETSSHDSGSARTPRERARATMDAHDKVNILMVDDQPAKLLSYEVILHELGENLIPATSGREALAHLLHTDIAVVLMDVHVPEIDGRSEERRVE